MFEEDFERWIRRVRKMFEDFDKLFEEAFREAVEGRREERFGPKVYYYGFSITFDKDGRPIIREWGNIRPGVIRPAVTEEIEPYTEVLDEDGKYKVIIEMPGVDKDKIKVRASKNRLIVTASSDYRKYRKEVRFKEPVKPETAKAQYRNGVLVVEIEKEAPKKEEGVEIKIE